MRLDLPTAGRVARRWLPVAAWLACSLFTTAQAADDIVVAQIGPFTGLPSPDAPDINTGAKAYFEQVNRSGGINGRKITLFTLDDRFTADGFKAALPQAL